MLYSMTIHFVINIYCNRWNFFPLKTSKIAKGPKNNDIRWYLGIHTFFIINYHPSGLTVLSIHFLYSAARSVDMIEISSKLSVLESLKSDCNCKFSFWLLLSTSEVRKWLSCHFWAYTHYLCWEIWALQHKNTKFFKPLVGLLPL